MKEIWDKYKELIIYILICSISISLFLSIGYCIGYNKGKKQKEIVYSPPVEKKVIDTLYITRDRIITKIQQLETIKYDTIQKVYILDDTASLDLFYKLVSE